jgi:hypothetical protein
MNLDEFAEMMRQRINAYEILLTGLLTMLRSTQPEIWEPVAQLLLGAADRETEGGQNYTAAEMRRILEKNSVIGRQTLTVIQGGKTDHPAEKP